MRAAGVLAILLAGCASQPPHPAEIAEREYRRENARVLAIEQYHERKRQCAARGGTLQLPRSTSGRLPPTVGELRLASCGLNSALRQWL